MARRMSAPQMVYLPAGGMMGMSMDQPPAKGALRPVGKTIHIQHLGTVVGQRGAGLNAIPGESNQLSHSFNHYGKGGLRGLDEGGMF